MKIALLSDIHGNATALRAVLEQVKKLNVDRLFCCGDLVGYYYEPGACIDMLMEWNIECVRGNHEDLLFQIMADPGTKPSIRKKYGSALELAAGLLSTRHLDYLAALPRTRTLFVEEKQVLLCHGAPWDTDKYIYPDGDDALFERCADTGADWVVCGHTHYQLQRKIRNCNIVNPGSVGQPRGKYRGSAHWALLDVVAMRCELMSTEYDATDVISQARQNDPDVDYLTSILTKV